jgi:hypothetical protein
MISGRRNRHLAAAIDEAGNRSIAGRTTIFIQ